MACRDGNGIFTTLQGLRNHLRYSDCKNWDKHVAVQLGLPLPAEPEPGKPESAPASPVASPPADSPVGDALFDGLPPAPGGPPPPAWMMRRGGGGLDLEPGAAAATAEGRFGLPELLPSLNLPEPPRPPTNCPSDGNPLGGGRFLSKLPPKDLDFLELVFCKLKRRLSK